LSAQLGAEHPQEYVEIKLKSAARNGCGFVIGYDYFCSNCIQPSKAILKFHFHATLIWPDGPFNSEDSRADPYK
jgi:hypothetical protein